MTPHEWKKTSQETDLNPPTWRCDRCGAEVDHENPDFVMEVARTGMLVDEQSEDWWGVDCDATVAKRLHLS